MAGPLRLRLLPRELTAVLLLLVAALFIQAWITAGIEARPGGPAHATNLARLLVLPLLLAAARLAVPGRPRLFRRLFRLPPRAGGLLLKALAIGVLMRVFWWSQATARAALGLGAGSAAPENGLLSISYACPAGSVVAVAILAWCIAVPVTEEFIHRGLVLSAFAGRGAAVAVTLSAAVFALAHPSPDLPLVFAAGLVFGMQYWRSGTLLAPVVTHATYDGLQIVDWLCLRIRWLPDPDSLPLWPTALFAVVAGVLAAAGIGWLLEKPGRKRPSLPSRP